MQKLVEKVQHYRIFWENAELNCRLEKRPLPDETDDGSFTGFDYSLFLLKSDLNQTYSDTITSWTKSNPKRIQSRKNLNGSKKDSRHIWKNIFTKLRLGQNWYSSTSNPNIYEALIHFRRQQMYKDAMARKQNHHNFEE